MNCVDYYNEDFMSVGISVSEGGNAKIRNNRFYGVAQPIVMDSSCDSEISGNMFSHAKDAVTLNNCYGKISVNKNSAYNVKKLVSVNSTEKNMKLFKRSRNRTTAFETEFRKSIQYLHNLEAEAKFLKKHKNVILIKYLKSNFGTARSKLLFKQLLHKALR